VKQAPPIIPFTGNPLDRVSAERVDAAWLAARREAAGTRVLPMWRLQPFLTGPENGVGPRLGFVSADTADGLGRDAAEVILGLDNGVAVFARDISSLDDPLDGPLKRLGHFRDARSAAYSVGGTDAAIIGHARSLLDWHARHQFCAQCGARTELRDAGYRRLCPSCQAEHFPRTDPAVIMLIVNGDHCMLGRNRRFPDGYFSALAGFVEPGENIEEAVRRETFEEAGVRIGAVRYVASQYWPFPSSLMIGCIADADGRETKPDGVEILETRWFDKETIRGMLEGAITIEGVKLPQPIAIAHHLLRAWINI
jgi:NAD+ diphosphatase